MSNWQRALAATLAYQRRIDALGPPILETDAQADGGHGHVDGACAAGLSLRRRQPT